MVLKKSFFRIRTCGTRDPPPHGNTILNFHFDYWNPSLIRFASCDAITLLSIVLTSLRIAPGTTNNKAGPAVSRGLLLNCERKGYCWLLKLNWLANIAANGVQSHWTLKWLGWTNQSSSNFNIYLQRCCSKQILPGLFSGCRFHNQDQAAGFDLK